VRSGLSQWRRCLTLAAQLIYLIAEVAQHLIKAAAKSHNWNISTYVGKVTLPQDLYRPLPPEDARRVFKTTYLEAKAIEALDPAKPKAKVR
jgi:sister-chromatid-cohesion protein PDS5